jgi:hypothetical protein
VYFSSVLLTIFSKNASFSGCKTSCSVIWVGCKKYALVPTHHVQGPLQCLEETWPYLPDDILLLGGLVCNPLKGKLVLGELLRNLCKALPSTSGQSSQHEVHGKGWQLGSKKARRGPIAILILKQKDSFKTDIGFKLPREKYLWQINRYAILVLDSQKLGVPLPPLRRACDMT